MSKAEPRSASTLEDVLATLQAETGASNSRLPPVHLWNPEHCGDIGLRIDRDGVWRQDGVRFTREKLVRLFSTILRRDPDGYYLVTPHEKVVVHVEDAPFTATRVDRAEDGGRQMIAVTTNVGDVVVMGADHPLRVVTDPETGEPACYVAIRAGLEAKLARPPFYELVALADADPETGVLWVRSGDSRFQLGTYQ